MSDFRKGDVFVLRTRTGDMKYVLEAMWGDIYVLVSDAPILSQAILYTRNDICEVLQNGSMMYIPKKRPVSEFEKQFR